jgi:hypothetical protein
MLYYKTKKRVSKNPLAFARSGKVAKLLCNLLRLRRWQQQQLRLLPYPVHFFLTPALHLISGDAKRIK